MGFLHFESGSCPFCFNSRLLLHFSHLLSLQASFQQDRQLSPELICTVHLLIGKKEKKEKVHAACMLLANWMHQNKDTTQLIPHCRDLHYLSWQHTIVQEELPNYITYFATSWHYSTSIIPICKFLAPGWLNLITHPLLMGLRV